MEKFRFTYFVIAVILSACDPPVPEPIMGLSVTIGNDKLQTTKVSCSYNNALGEELYIEAFFPTSGQPAGLTLVISTPNANSELEEREYKIAGLDAGVPEATLSYLPAFPASPFASQSMEGVTVGTVTITKLNRDKRQVSGTFECTVKSGNNEVIDIKQGTFTKIQF